MTKYGNYSTKELYSVNQRIRVPEVRVITSQAENLGVMKTYEALRIAEERGLDLVLITANANPPVAKILDYNKFLYDERKKSSSIKAGSKKSELKEFVFGPTIGEGDIATRVERTREFLKDGNRVKISVKMKGREGEYPQLAIEKIRRFETDLKDLAKTEAEPKRNGNVITVTFTKI